MALIPAEKREPFRPPPREPLPELDAVEGALPTSPVVEITGVEVAVVVDATVVDQTVPSLPVSVDLPVADQRAVDQIPEPAAAPDAILAPEAVPSVAPETAQPPDEFGAGLGDSPQNPPV